MDPVVILGSETVSVGPGEEHRLPVRVRNQGRRVESYRVDVIGAPAAFAEVAPSVVSVLPGREAELAVTFRPSGGSSTPTGSLAFAVRATSEVDPSSSAVTEGRLELAGVAGLQAWAPETTRSGRWKATFHVEFANQGNAAARLALTAHDPTATMRLQLDRDVIDLSPGGRSTAEVQAKTRVPFLLGSPVTRSIQIACQTFPFGAERPTPGAAPPEGDPNHRTFQLVFQQRPILPKFAIPLIVLAIVGLIAFAVFKLRGDERPELALASPNAPAQLQATPGGPSSILLSWEPVANAEGYRVVQTSVNGVEDEQTIEEALAPDIRTKQVEDLAADTEYCFTVQAIGTDEKTSAASVQGCARTSPPTQLEAPSGVNAVREAGDTYRVTWQHSGLPEGVEYRILVDGAPQGPFPTLSVVIPIPSEDVERPVAVQVQAVLGEDESELSEAFQLLVPALATETTAAGPATSEAAPPTTAAGQGQPPPTTTAGNATTSTPPTASATDPPIVDELENLDPVVVAMLFAVNSPAQGGLPLDQVKIALSESYGIPAELMKTFSNRDTLVEVVPASAAALDFADAPADRRFVYVTETAPGATPLDETSAAAVCAPNPTNCRVLRLVGAAAASEGEFIAILSVPPAEISTGQVDEMLDTLRDELDWPSIHVLNGVDYNLLANPRPVIYARDFDTQQEATTFCVQHASEVDVCNVQTLEAAD